MYVSINSSCCPLLFWQTQSRMKLIADNYEEDHNHPQHHPHHSHHMHPANVHHRSLPRGPPMANHRSAMDQVNTHLRATKSFGMFKQIDTL